MKFLGDIMKRIVWNITLASIITLVAYIALYAIWGAILSGVKSPTLKLFLVALMTTAAFGFFLLWISKIRHAVGEHEVVGDYRDREYISLMDDGKLVIKSEARVLIGIAAIVMICFLLNTFDLLVFKRKVLSLSTFFFMPMCLFDAAINVPFVGYALSAVLDCAVYILFLLMYRKKKYKYWMENA